MNCIHLLTIVAGFCLIAGCQSAVAPTAPTATAVAEPRPFHVLVMAETGGVHAPFVAAAKIWLADLSAREHFTLDYIENAANINDDYLSHYQLFLQLNYPPYGWGTTATDAFQKYT